VKHIDLVKTYLLLLTSNAADTFRDPFIRSRPVG